jgi:hypothetical protein
MSNILDIAKLMTEKSFNEIIILITLAIIMFALPKAITFFLERESRLFLKIDRIDTLSQSISQNKDPLISKVLKMKLYARVYKILYSDFGIHVETIDKIKQLEKLCNTEVNLYDIKKLIRLDLMKIFSTRIEFYSLKRRKYKNFIAIMLNRLFWVVCVFFLFVGLLICFETKEITVGIYSIVIGFIFEVMAINTYDYNYYSKKKYKKIFRSVCKLDGVIFKNENR